MDLLRLYLLRIVSWSAKAAQSIFTVVFSQQFPFHAEDSVDDLLLLAGHYDEASSQLS
jgi:hypothetical protein